MGCYEVSLGDTVGVGAPADVHKLIQYLLAAGIPVERLAGHFHDTYGQAIANVWAAYSYGIRVFDSSVAGLGGCPYAPGARGNLATEDLVYSLHQSGLKTGVDLSKLVDVGVWISGQLAAVNSSRAGSALASKALEASTSQAPSPPKLGSIQRVFRATTTFSSFGFSGRSICRKRPFAAARSDCFPQHPEPSCAPSLGPRTPRPTPCAMDIARTPGNPVQSWPPGSSSRI